MAFGILRRIVEGTVGLGQRPDMPPHHVARACVVIGDIHGRADLLDHMLRRLRTEAPGLPLVFVGDYIDRGPDSAAVLQHLKGLSDATCLMGNHERMCLKFLDTPSRSGPRWLRYGGLETLASYGVAAPAGNGLGARDRLVETMGEETIDWLRHLPLFDQNGNLYVTHAGADPRRAIELQNETTLIWGHADFLRRGRRDGAWVVHGHTIVTKPLVQNGRISIDTGAYATGCLTAAIFEGENVRFVQTN